MVAAAALTDQVLVSVSALLSVTVTVWLPEVRRVTPLVKVWVPLSEEEKVYGTGRMALLSEDVKLTVPL